MPPPTTASSVAAAAAVAFDAARKNHPPPYFHFGWPFPNTYAQQGWWWPSLLPSPSSQTPGSAASASAYATNITPHVVSTSVDATSNTPSVVFLPLSFQVGQECIDGDDVEVDEDEIAFAGNTTFVEDAPCEDMKWMRMQYYALHQMILANFWRHFWQHFSKISIYHKMLSMRTQRRIQIAPLFPSEIWL